jgi:hypothetical protein
MNWKVGVGWREGDGDTIQSVTVTLEDGWLESF